MKEGNSSQRGSATHHATGNGHFRRSRFLLWLGLSVDSEIANNLPIEISSALALSPKVLLLPILVSNDSEDRTCSIPDFAVRGNSNCVANDA